MLRREHYETREEWLAARNIGGRLGASEAAACLGISPWMSPYQLWEIKTGQVQPKDLSDNAAISLGVRMEPVLRDFYRAENPDKVVEYHPYDLLYQEERPWQFATLDGEITDADGRRGIFEAKTATPSGKAGWEKWNGGNVPQNYFSQILHALSATGFEFVDLCAGLFSLNGDCAIRTYHFERSDHVGDIEYVTERERQMIMSIQRRTPPPTILVF